MSDPITYILANLRARDAREIAETGASLKEIDAAFHSPSALVQVWASEVTGNPACVVGFRAMTPRAVYAAMLATDDWRDVARQVVRWAKWARNDLLRQGFVRAECRTMEGHDEAIRLLEHFGFRLEARLARYGKSGTAFLQYAWCVDDHVVEAAAARQQSLPKCNGCGEGQDWQV